MKVTITLFVGLISWCASAQSLFKVVSDGGEPLVGATAFIVSLSDSTSEQLVSDFEGYVKTDLTLPLQVEVRYVGFETAMFTIQASNQRIQLASSTQSLDEVVVTGQYQPQSAKNTVYNVRSIGSDRIASQNANTIYEVLANELNIQISRDNATGRSGITMQGLSGQYTKILLDGVPLIGKGGIDNDIDLSSVDIHQVERIEIVEGPMAVNYGADALAGVINIITKKDIPTKFQATVVIQTEAAGDEYALFDEGIHSPSISLGYQLNDHWFSQLSGRYYKFGGWQGNSEGRQKQWHPKEQRFGGFLTRYATDQWEIYYRFDVLDEVITNLGGLVVPNDNDEPYAFDEEYHADRFIHQIQSDLQIGNSATLNSVLSFTDYERRSLNFRRFPLSGIELAVSNGNDTISYQAWFTRQTLNNIHLGSHVDAQIGVESTYEKAGGSTLSDGDKSITDVAVFASTEFTISKLKIRPGIRYTYNSQFTTIPTPAVNFSWNFSTRTQLRWSYGRGFRAPSVRELYHEFIDTNHNLIGNPDLRPEKSHNLNVSLDHEVQKIPVSFEIGGFYNDIAQLIGISVSEDGRQQSYINVFEFKSLGGNLRTNYKSGGFKGTLGFSRIGRLQQLRNEAGVPDFVFASELIVRIEYIINSIGLTVSSFYKYTGSINRYQTDSETDEIREFGQEGFHNLDINLSRSFGSFKLGAGIRNALDIINIQTTASGGVHSGGNAIPIGFGRSFYLRLNYQFNL